jgi:hypothetical protein
VALAVIVSSVASEVDGDRLAEQEPVGLAVLGEQPDA